MKALLTRPVEQSLEMAGELASDGIDCLIWPLTRIVPAADAPAIAPGTGGVLFTSANGVRAFAAAYSERDLPALCVGMRTAQTARDAGFIDTHIGGGDASALANLTLEFARRTGTGRFLHARGAHAAGDLSDRLVAAGLVIDEAILYRAEETGHPPAEVSAALDAGEIRLLTVWSPRGANILARRLRGRSVAACTALAISPAAAQPLALMPLAETRIAEKPSGSAMSAAIRLYFRENRG